MKGTCKSFLNPLDSSENTGEETFIVSGQGFLPTAVQNELTGKKWSEWEDPNINRPSPPKCNNHIHPLSAPHQGDVWFHARTTSTFSFQCGGAAALLWVPQMAEVLTLCLRESPAPLQKKPVSTVSICKLIPQVFISDTSTSSSLAGALFLTYQKKYLLSV